MEIVMDDYVRGKLDDAYIFQARTGMFLFREERKYRWKNGDKIYCSTGCIIEPFTTFDSGNNLYTCGAFSSIASDLPINSVVGRYTSIGGGCRMMGFRHPVESVSMSSAMFNFYRENIAAYFDRYEVEYGNVIKKGVPIPQPQKQALVIGNDVWIGENCTLCGGISVGTGAVIASNSVVLRDVPPYTLVAGIPAKIKKLRFAPDIIHALLESKWWEYELGDMYKEEMDFSSPAIFLKQFEKKNDNLRKFNPMPFVPVLDLSKVSFKDQHRSIVTDFGTALYIDSENRLKHGNGSDNLVKISSTNELIYNDRCTNVKSILNGYNIGSSNVNNRFEIVRNVDSSISIKFDNLYLSARREGVFSLVENLDLWEKFRVVQ